MPKAASSSLESAGLSHSLPAARAVVEQALRRGEIGCRCRPERRRNLQQLLLVGGEQRERSDGVDRGFGRGEGRNPILGEALARGRHRVAPHPAREDRLALGFGHRDQFGREQARIGERERRHDGEQRIDLAVLQARLRRLRVDLRGRVAANVDGIAIRGTGRQQRMQLLERCLLQPGHRQPPIDGAVGGELPGPARVRHDAQPAPAYPHAGTERARCAEQLAEIADAQHAGATHRRIENIVATHQRTRVEGEAAAPFERMPGFHDDDGLYAGRGPQRAHEAARVTHTFEVEHDSVGRRIAREEIEHVPEADVIADAGGDHRRESHVPGACPVEGRRTQRARLRHERETAWIGERPATGCVESAVGPDQTETVRPKQAQPVAARDLQHRPFAGCALIAALAESGGYDDCPAHAALAAMLEHDWQGVWRGGDDHEVDGLRQ